MAIWTIAKTTVGEAMRKKVLNVCLIVALAMIVLSLSFTQLGFRQDMTVVKALGLFVIMLAGFIISVLMSISLIPTEIERRTIYTILSKPVSRVEFLLGKYLGGIITLFINIALMGTVFIVTVAIKAKLTAVQLGSIHGMQVGEEVIKPQLFDPSLALGVVLIYLQFVVLAAVVMLFSTFLTPTVNFFASSAFYVVGSAANVWRTMYMNEKASVFVKVFYWFISTFVANFDRYSVQNKLIHPEEVASMPAYVAAILAYSILYCILTMLVAVICFYRKEV
jgi:ABC-type transport system involved in multi-copper enzyme maturation permease subunit